MKSLTLCIFLAATLVLPSATFATNVSDTPTIDILYGAYEIIGRQPGGLAPTYRGWMRIAVEGDRLMLDRCVNGTHTEGTGFLTTVTSNDRPAVQLNYLHGEKKQQATCIYLNDFDNLPRFSCYTYPHEAVSPKDGRRLAPDLSQNPTDNAKTEVPGLESAFPITWPVPMDYFSCN